MGRWELQTHGRHKVPGVSPGEKGAVLAAGMGVTGTAKRGGTATGCATGATSVRVPQARSSLISGNPWRARTVPLSPSSLTQGVRGAGDTAQARLAGGRCHFSPQEPGLQFQKIK